MKTNYKKYRLTKSDHPFWLDKKNNRFARLMPRFLSLQAEYHNADHLVVDSLKMDRVDVEASTYGLTLLKLAFFRPYFTIEELK